jgi:O-antigen ligase
MSVRLPALAFGALIVASVITVDPGGLAPFGPSKWLVVSVIAPLAAALSLRTGTARAHRPSWWAWVALLGLLTASALTNGDWRVALLGHPDRHLGVLTWLLFLATFCAGQRLAAADPAVCAASLAVIARAAVIAAAALGVYAVWELAFGAPIEVATSTRRLLGPFGSAAFLGAACCLLGPVALGVAFDQSHDRRWRWLSAAAGALVGMALVGSGTRAAWIGAVVATAVVVVAVRPRRRSLLICLTGLGIATLAVTPRLGDVGSRQQGAASRMDEWRVAARVIGRHPLLGVGPEGYRIAAAEGIDDAYERAHRRDTVLPDRAHSAPLDVTLDGGLGAGLLYVGLMGFAVWRALRLIRTRAPLSAGIGAAIIAYAAQQLLLFPLAELDPIWWLFCGLAAALTSPAAPAAAPVVVVVVVARRAPAIALAIPAVMLVGGVLDVAADRLARTALQPPSGTVGRGTVGGTVAIDSAERAVSLRPDVIRYRLVAAQAHLQRGTIADIDAAIAESRRATDWSPNDPFAVDELATAMSQRAVATGTAGDVGGALAQWQRLVERDPHRASWQLALGQAAALAGDTDLARAAWTIADDLGEPQAAQLLAALAAAS